MGRTVYVAALCASMVGCYYEPTFGASGDAGDARTDTLDGDDAGPDGLPSASVMDGPLVLRNSMFRVTFAATKPFMPESLRFHSSDSVDRYAAGNFGESRAGMSFAYDYTLASGSPVPTDLTAAIAILERGPARASVEITWSAHNPCPSTTDTPLTNNTSRFSVYPDGRMLRHDVVNWTESCGVSILGSHNVFATEGAASTFVTKNSEAIVRYSPPTTTQVDVTNSTGTGWGCLERDNAAIGVTWHRPGPSDWEMFEFGRSPLEAVAMNYYFRENTAPIADRQYVADTLTGAIPGSCESDLGPAYLDPFQNPAAVENATWLPAEGAYRFDDGETPIVAIEEIKPGFAIILPGTGIPPALQRGSENVGRIKTLTLDVDYRAQVVGNTVLVWVAEALLPAETLTVPL